MKEQLDTTSFASILEAGCKMDKHQQDFLNNLSTSFSGFQIIENQLLGENEIAIICGSKAYKALYSRAEDQE